MSPHQRQRLFALITPSALEINNIAKKNLVYHPNGPTMPPSLVTNGEHLWHEAMPHVPWPRSAYPLWVYIWACGYDHGEASLSPSLSHTHTHTHNSQILSKIVSIMSRNQLVIYTPLVDYLVCNIFLYHKHLSLCSSHIFVTLLF